ncbi:MAG: serine/threonine-protein kinase [Kofleriaceae bacterium]
MSEVGSTANTYAILAKLAAGGMAEIFLARTESAAGVERYVVLKRILDHRSTDIKFVNMFLDEARLASQLQHPNIAQVYDTGKLGDSYFFTMEYVHGETVRELLQQAYAASVHVPITCVLTIIAGAAAGLQHAHGRIGFDGRLLGIVHRDVSPSNLMISYEGHVKVVDFGVAKATHRSTETHSGSVKGKIGYMSPEQCRGGVVDQRCDLFSLGIVMWELLAGERLFKRATDFESMTAIVDEAVPPPSERRIDIPNQLDEVVLKLLAKHPDDRYQSGDELVEAIELVASRIGEVISIPKLRKFVHELFGQRPEPWIVVRERAAALDVVTVTGLSLEEAFPEVSMRTELAKVVDLSTHSSIELPSMAESTRHLGRIPFARSEVTGPTRTNTNLAVGSTAMPAAQRPPQSTKIVGVEPRRWPWAVAGLFGVFAVTLAVLYVTASPETSTSVVTSPIEPAKPPADAASVPASAAADPVRTPAKPVTLGERYQAARYVEVVAECANAAALRTNPELCTLAACREHDLDHARRWVQRIPGPRQGGVTTACAEFGSVISRRVPTRVGPTVHGKEPVNPPKPEPPKPEPPKPCDNSDPMACRK